MDYRTLRELVDQLFTKRTSYISLCQEIAENFYPERADFTVRRDIGDEFASYLSTSYPVIVSRELGDQIGAMLRPSGKEWNHIATQDPERENNDAKRWLEMAEGTMRRAMYDPITQFTRATKEGDRDFSTFGQCVLSVRTNRNRNALLYRCWHIRDVVWLENEEGRICLVAVKWRPTVREMRGMFRNIHPNVEQLATQNKLFDEIDCYHIVCDADLYDGNSKRMPYWSIFMDCQHDHVMEAIPTWNKEYIIPRWQTVSGSQYAYSPATIVALADARLIQAMTYTLLEAGEKLTNPPMVATEDAVRSDIAIYPGGITWIDRDYDEKLGEALRPMTIDAKGMPIGVEMQRDARVLLREAFFLNKLRAFNPASDPTMTAFQAGQIVQEYIRGAMPIFEPMEASYNGQLCDITFENLLHNGAFGAPQDMPPSLRGADLQFRFESPLHDAIEAQKGHKFMEMKALIAEAVALDQSALALPDVKVALRDALNGIRTPATWVRNEVTVKQIESAQQAAAKAEQVLGAMEQGSNVALNLSKANKELTQAA